MTKAAPKGPISKYITLKDQVPTYRFEQEEDKHSDYNSNNHLKFLHLEKSLRNFSLFLVIFPCPVFQNNLISVNI